MREASEQGLLGKKGKKGFYNYPPQGKQSPNLAIDGLLHLAREKDSSVEQINRMLYLMVNEAARCLEEQVVASPYDIDTGMVFGIGFPPFRGGLCRWADSIGCATITEELKRLADAYGERFTPQGNVARGESFYP